MQTRTERCNETRYPCWCNFGAYSGLKVILRIYHKIELIPPVLTGPVQDGIIIILRSGRGATCTALHTDRCRLETLRKSLD